MSTDMSRKRVKRRNWAKGAEPYLLRATRVAGLAGCGPGHITSGQLVDIV
jgi:hypothetical protein